LDPAIRCAEAGSAAMLGSFCLFVGNRAVTFDDGSPAT
jgi:hypothetical protein